MFTAKAKKQKEPYHLSYINEKGEREWYFLQVNPLMEKKFLLDMKVKKTIDLPNYGDIIASGVGEPSQELKKRFVGN